MMSVNWIDVNENRMNPDTYFEILIREFPLIRKDIEEEESDMVHFRMERFADYTIEQIKTNNYKELVRCFEFQESKIDLINSDLENALVVSYCESLLLGDQANKMGEIVEIMPTKLKTIYLDYKIYYNKLCESYKKRN